MLLVNSILALCNMAYDTGQNPISLRPPISYQNLIFFWNDYVLTTSVVIVRPECTETTSDGVP